MMIRKETSVRFTVTVAMSVLWAVALAVGFAMAEETPAGLAIYKKYCVECHGPRLEGQTAGPLIKEDWLYGRRRSRLEQNITFGIPDTNMPGWGEAIPKGEIKELVKFIMEAQDGGLAQSPPLPAVVDTRLHRIRTEVVVAEGIDTPWGIEFVDHRHALFTEKPGRLRWLIDGRLNPVAIVLHRRYVFTMEESTAGGRAGVGTISSITDRRPNGH